MQQTKLDTKVLRNVAGSFATGITVITTKNENGGIHGMTANSFLSVSLDPPFVSCAVKENGSLMKYLRKNKLVGITVLSDSQKNISSQFAGREQEGLIVEFENHPEGISTIKEGMAWYVTVIHDIILAGDHYLIMCKILKLKRNEDKKPLLYFSGYKSIGEEI